MPLSVSLHQRYGQIGVGGTASRHQSIHVLRPQLGQITGNDQSLIASRVTKRVDRGAERPRIIGRVADVSYFWDVFQKVEDAAVPSDDLNRTEVARRRDDPGQ